MKIKTLALIFLSLAMSVSSWGYSFAYNGIYYNILSGNTSVEVTYGTYNFNSYSGRVTIPSTVNYSGRSYSVTSIGVEAFSSCTGLTSVTLPNSVTSIGNWAFFDCTGLTSVTLPNSVTSIGIWAFSGCTGLTSVTLPNNVTSIGILAFYGCTGLTAPLYNNTIFAYMPTSYSGSYTIPSGITTIAGSAFKGCTGLTSVTLPNSVTSIGNDAFYGCTGLTSVTLPNSVTSIGDYAFENCTGLTSVTLPNSVTSIGYKAFANCTGLTSVYFKRATPPTIGSDCFYSANPTYYVPCGTTSAYKTKLGASSTIVESFEYTVTVLPSDTLLGTVAITQQPSCQQPAVIQASAIPHYHFKQWSDGNTSNPRTINVTSDTSLTAFFEIDRHTVSSNSSLVEGTGEYDYGTTVTLTAHSEEHIHFIEWEDGVTDSTRSFVLQVDVTMNAVYELDSFLIQTTCLHGTVSGGGKYGYSDIVTLTVTPDEGYRFVKWSDDNEYNPRIFVAREDLTVEAICEEAPVIDDVENVEADTPAFYIVGSIIYNPDNEPLRVYSTEGKLIKTGNSDINMECYPKGMYIVVDSRGNAIKVPLH